jgi:23S rRNA (cytosine1962-C5)-methyltransferase
MVKAAATRGAVRATLVKKLERAIAQGHPWIYRDALAGLDAPPGAVVEVCDRRGRFVARGLADEGPIGVRVWTRDRRQPIDLALMNARMLEAARLRDRVVPQATSAYRLLHGEGDRLPGVVCDVYGSTAVLELDGKSLALWRDTVVSALEPQLAARAVTTLLASPRRGPRHALYGMLPSEPIRVSERGMQLVVDVVHGQKTGLFLDHRESRYRVRQIAEGLSVLNLYAYTGGFSVAAGLGGARAVTTVDRARPALALAEQSWRENGLEATGHEVHAGDAFEFLDAAARSDRRWDLVIVDPPSFAPREANLEAALASYQKLHELAMAVVAPGGLYLAASCSSHVRAEAFEETVQKAASSHRVMLQLLERWGAPADHPRLTAFPEGDYLKVVLVRPLRSRSPSR